LKISDTYDYFCWKFAAFLDKIDILDLKNTFITKNHKPKISHRNVLLQQKLFIIGYLCVNLFVNSSYVRIYKQKEK
jgi:hypothetical protein